jgi:hypothetical protein
MTHYLHELSKLPQSREQKRAISSVLSFTGDTLYTIYVDLVSVRNPPDILVRSWDMVKGNVISDVTVPVWQPSEISRLLKPGYLYQGNVGVVLD